jgi:multiple sugar transport system permease protein
MALSGGKARRSVAQRKARAFYLFITPWAVGFLIFTAGPILASLGLSLTKYDIIMPPEFVALDNFRELFQDALFYKSLANTAYIVVLAVPLGMIIAFALALLLNQKVRGMAGYRTAFYLPSIVPAVGSAVLWRFLLQPQWGPINGALRLIGLQGPGWLSSETWSKPALILVMLWMSGGPMVIYLAGLQDIPQSLYEAAAIDGAGSWPKFIHITLPLMTPSIFFTLVMRTINIFQVFGIVYVMTDGMGGPLNSTLVYLVYLYRNGFSYFRMGYASAMAWILFLIILLLTFLQFRLARSWVHYEVEPGGSA